MRSTRLLVLTLASGLLMSACTRTGLNAGKQGGIAFIGLAGMLIVISLILWIFLGREE